MTRCWFDEAGQQVHTDLTEDKMAIAVYVYQRELVAAHKLISELENSRSRIGTYIMGCLFLVLLLQHF